MWGCFLMSGVKILHFLKDWWKSIPIHQNYTMALNCFSLNMVSTLQALSLHVDLSKLQVMFILLNSHPFHNLLYSYMQVYTKGDKI